MSLISTLVRFAGSSHGRRAIAKAQRYAQSPQGKAKLEQVRRQLASRKGMGGPR